jgi:HK97 family phage prohead protease
MPYHISSEMQGCAGWAVVKDSTSEIMGCHETEQDALAQLAALHINEPDARAVDMSAPDFMRNNAKRGLQYYEQGLGGDGLVRQTIADARRMAAGEISEAKWRKIAPWISRHMVDLEAVEGNEVTPGVVAHLLWGSGRTKTGATRAMKYAERVVAQLDAEQQTSERSGSEVADTVGGTDMDISIRQLPPSYRPSSSDDVPVMRPACGSCEYFCVVADMAMEGEPQPHCHRWNEPVAIDGYCDAYEPKEQEPESELESEPMQEPGMMMEEDSTRSVGWVSVQKDEKRTVAYSNMELRAEGENGNTIVGYAAVFDSPSVDMGFIEYVSRGAFTKTLKDGADVRLLLDHEGAPLARTRSGTLRLSEDERGLKVEADLDPTNPLAQTVLSALRRGDMNQMSFAFRTIRDSWSKDGAVRELREVQLYDVSVVTFPAYEATVAEVRARQDGTLRNESRTRLRKAQVKLAQVNLNR